jgi:hypothetical protein
MEPLSYCKHGRVPPAQGLIKVWGGHRWATPANEKAGFRDSPRRLQVKETSCCWRYNAFGAKKDREEGPAARVERWQRGKVSEAAEKSRPGRRVLQLVTRPAGCGRGGTWIPHTTVDPR